MTQAEDYIYQKEGNQREIMLFLHQLLTEEMNLRENMRFKIPFYDRKSWVCYLNPLKNGKVELAFVRGIELSNVQGILDCKGRKQVFGIEIEKVADIPYKALTEIIQEAILLDDTKTYSLKQKK